MEEVRACRKDDDLLLDWITEDDNADVLLLEESVDVALLQKVVTTGYAPDLRDEEVEKIGRDPFLNRLCASKLSDRCVVMTEVSRPSAQRQNRKIPDVCRALNVQCIGPFMLNRNLGFRAGWRDTGGTDHPKRPADILAAGPSVFHN